MTPIVKITEIEKEKTLDNKWHYVVNMGGAECTFCSMQVFRDGDIDAVYHSKSGKVTCPKCIELIKMIKKAEYKTIK